MFQDVTDAAVVGCVWCRGVECVGCGTVVCDCVCLCVAGVDV